MNQRMFKAGFRLGIRSLQLGLKQLIRGDITVARIRWQQVKVCYRVMKKSIFPSTNG